MKPIYLYVRQEDIDNGEPGECDRCPLALSASRRFKAKDVMVVPPDYGSAMLWELVVTKPRSQMTYTLPHQAIAFANDFDDLRTPRPEPIRIRIA